MNPESRKPSSVRFAKALADPTRQEIMELICCRELSVGEIVETVGVSQPTVSHHLCCGNLIEVFAPQSEAADMILVQSESTDST